MQPHSPDPYIVTPADLAECRALIREGSKTFFTASKLLPQRVCDAARSLYGFCRVADDAVDLSSDSRGAVDALLKRLDGIYRLQPGDHPADRAFADVAWRYSIPRALPEALIEGFLWDAEGRIYEDLSGIVDYGVRVAGTVGAMMSVIMQVRDPVAIARACDLGIAMQLTNICRDVGEDARNGRLYLPRQWLREAGIDPEAWLRDPKASPQLTTVIARLLAEADRLYARADAGIGMLPAACRPSINAARLLYAEIGREVERNGHDSVTRRAVVPKPRKIARLVRAIGASLARWPVNDEPAVAEAQFLVDAVAAAPQPRRHPRGFDEKAAWLVDLFTRLEKTRP